MSHIVRINNPRNHTVGYQFRCKCHTKLFSDSQYGSSFKAKKAAHAHKAEHDATCQSKRSPLPLIRAKKRGNRNNRSKIRGVYRTHEWNRGNPPRLRKYWVAHYTIDREGRKTSRTKKYYIENHGELEAKRLAVEFRAGWEKAVQKGPEAIADFFREEQMRKTLASEHR